jgi:hypothetical protein
VTHRGIVISNIYIYNYEKWGIQSLYGSQARTGSVKTGVGIGKGLRGAR